MIKLLGKVYMADFNIVNTANFVIDILDQDGGIKFNTAMVDHNYDLANDISKSEFKQLKNHQTIIIGVKGQPITKNDIKTFLTTLYNYMQQEVFQNGRSYCFEGIHKVKHNKYEIHWGS